MGILHQEKHGMIVSRMAPQLGDDVGAGGRSPGDTTDDMMVT